MRAIIVLLCLFSGPLWADTLTFTNALVSKQFPNADGDDFLAINRTVADWCASRNYGFNIGAYGVGTAVDGLTNGLYNCDGQFVVQPGSAKCVAFALSNCQPLDPVALKNTCPPTPPNTSVPSH